MSSYGAYDLDKFFSLTLSQIELLVGSIERRRGIDATEMMFGVRNAVWAKAEDLERYLDVKTGQKELVVPLSDKPVSGFKMTKE